MGSPGDLHAILRSILTGHMFFFSGWTTIVMVPRMVMETQIPFSWPVRGILQSFDAPLPSRHPPWYITTSLSLERSLYSLCCFSKDNAGRHACMVSGNFNMYSSTHRFAGSISALAAWSKASFPSLPLLSMLAILFDISLFARSPIYHSSP